MLIINIIVPFLSFRDSCFNFFERT